MAGTSTFSVGPEPLAPPETGRIPILLPRPRLRPASEVAPRPKERLFPVAPALFRWLERRFVPGAATRLAGPSSLVSGFASFLLAAVTAEEGTVSLRDGANRFAPYTIVAVGRRWGLAGDPLLERIRLARAFTAHQMVTLLETWMDEEAGTAVPADLFVAGDPALLFASEEEVQPYERAALLPHVARCLARLLASVRRPMLLIEYAEAPGYPWETDGVPVHETLRLSAAPQGGARLDAVRAGEHLELVRLAGGQHHLEEFASEPELPSEGGIEPWDAPSPPTMMH